MIKRSSLLLPFILLCLCFESSLARWGNEKDAPIEVTLYNREIIVHENGTAKEKIEIKIKILNEAGRSGYSSYRLSYNHDCSKIKIKEAKTTYKGQEYAVDLAKIEDQPLASSPVGFDQGYQILIVFPNAEIGSELFLKYEQELTKPPLENFFETTFGYGFDGIWINSEVYVASELPFFIDINDPTGSLDVKQYKTGDMHHLDIKLTKKVFTQIFDENNAQINPKNLTLIHLSTIKSWEEYANKMKPDYTRVLNQKLPTIYQDIANQAKSKKFLVDQIDTVTSLLAEKIRYMGDWRSQAGRFIPRDLEDVATSQYGDCKDLSAATAAILNSIGIHSDLVLVTRGAWVYDNPSKLAGFKQFNHVIVKVTGAKETHWIDPTNIVSMAEGTFFDISDRNALVITSKNPSMEYIPAIDPNQFVTEIIQSINLKDKKLYKVSGDLHYNGNAANSLTASRLFASEESISHFLYNILGDPARMTEKNMALPPLTSRIVEDLSFTYDFIERSSEIKTNAGQGILLGIYQLDRYIVSKDRVSDLFAGEPRSLKIVKTFTHAKATQKKLKSVHLKSPWLDVERNLQYGKKHIKITDIINIKKSIISNADLKSKKFNKMRDELETNFTNGTAIIFERVS